MPQKALGGGIPCSFLEPFARSWSHFVGICRQKLTKSSKNDFWLRYRRALRGTAVERTWHFLTGNFQSFKLNQSTREVNQSTRVINQRV